MEAIKGLAVECKTSLTASAIRYAQLSAAAVAIIISRGSSVDYCFASPSMRACKGYRHLKKDANLPRDSLTRSFNQNSKNVESAIEDSDDSELNLWFHVYDEIPASEEVIGLGEYGRTLTVITADIPADDDERDSEWEEPRFR